MTALQTSDNTLSLSKYMDKTFESITRSDEEFGKALKKWKGLLFSSVRKVAAVSHQTEVDVFQDFLVPLSKISAMRSIPLYRYKNKVWEISKDDGFNVRLVSSRYNVRGRRVVWARKEFLVPVKKATMSSLVYTKIQQQASVMMRSSFVQKNGYEVTGTEEEIVKTRNSDYGEKYKTIEKNIVRKVIDEISLDHPFEDGEMFLKDVVEDVRSYSAEECCCRSDFEEKALARLSKTAQMLFKWSLMNPEVKDLEICQTLDLTKSQLGYAKREILKVYLELTGQEHKSVKCPYVVYDGGYYSCVGEEGESWVIKKMGGAVKVVPKEETEVDSMFYRTPIHFNASMVS